MKRILMPILCGLSLAGEVSAATYDVSGAFTFYAPDNSILSSGVTSGTYEDVSGLISLSGNAFYLGDWSAEGSISVDPGLYSLATGFAGTIANIDVVAGQWFGALFFGWGATGNNDAAHVWDVTNNLDGSILLTSTDVISDFYPSGSGVYGHPSIGGATVGFTYNVDLELTPAVVPVPAAVWLFGSGLLSLLGVARLKNTAE